jgi:hypothetical protein
MKKTFSRKPFFIRFQGQKNIFIVHYKFEWQFCPWSILKWHLDPMKNTILPLVPRQLLRAMKGKTIITLLESTMNLLICYNDLLRPFSFLLMTQTKHKVQPTLSILFAKSMSLRESTHVSWEGNHAITK